MPSDFKVGDSALGYNFKFSFGNIQCASVIDISGLKLEHQVVEVKSQTSKGQYVVSKLPGARMAGEFTVTRLLTDDTAMSDWWTKVQDGDVTGGRQTASVTILDVDRSTVVKAYKFDGCFIKSIETSSFKAGGSEMLTEKVTIVYNEGSVSKS